MDIAVPILPNPIIVFKQCDQDQHHHHHHHHQSTNFKFIHNNNSDHHQKSPNLSHLNPNPPAKMVPLFEKIVTPSDVGKLNRLVVPKQHAERHFPRLQAPSAGTQLSFQDGATGEHWCFRFSYWSSSQSYVMTKGWSRFVRKKRLSAGDTVYFFRDSACQNRFFIGFRHRCPIEVVSVSRPGGNYSDCDTRKVRKFTEAVAENINQPEKRIRLFGVNLEFLDPEKARIGVIEPSCVPFLDLKLGV